MAVLANATTSQFLHLTDFHIDPLYEASAGPNTNCHRRSLYSKSPPPVLGIAGSGCDSPILLVEETLKSLVLTDIDFVLWTGDSSRHDRDNQRRKQRLETYRDNRLAVDMLVKYVPPTIKIVPTIGNWDVFPVSQLECQENDPQLLNLWDVWSPLFPLDDPDTEAAKFTFLQGGYLSRMVLDGLVNVLSINSLSFFTENLLVPDCAKFELLPWGERPFDPAHIADRQLIWIEEMLIEARQSRTKVILQGHVSPMGNAEQLWKQECFEWYVYFSGEYSDVILHFTSQHTTQLEPAKPTPVNPFRLTTLVPNIIKSYDIKNWKIMSAIFTGSSIVPAYNPGYRVATLAFLPLHSGGWTVTLERHWTMYLDLAKANKVASSSQTPGGAPLNYKKSCDTRDDYGISDLGGDSLEKWVMVMQGAFPDLAKGKKPGEGAKILRRYGKCIETSLGVQWDEKGDPVDIVEDNVDGEWVLNGEMVAWVFGLMAVFGGVAVWIYCKRRYGDSNYTSGETTPLLG
ncbi:hypothetical protein BCR33DRAFT_722002 [Rhizoclosmatium globosum]|uniref:Calcineurin-like phosphoesterase domain-containing protein n=1 Tax=Rhizoclosmatium globosum TaxID=329046 RepID=A0A1Y2BP00_9FUNG|nr:hypothetical protein BCR33DRAFT_722002 [Rhizoclosmatium globosum]|eukprot:ORY36480.1 hypothetical protein BCR33DRAFT_722002 [Rhizoclosmatium globosum]